MKVTGGSKYCESFDFFPLYFIVCLVKTLVENFQRTLTLNKPNS